MQEIIQTVQITQFFFKAKARKLLCSPTPLQFIIFVWMLDALAERSPPAAQAAQSSQVLRPECSHLSQAPGGAGTLGSR